MHYVYRRLKNRPCPRIESLEARTLMATAGSPDPALGGTGYVSFPVLAASTVLMNGNTSGSVVSFSSAIALPNGNIVVAGEVTPYTQSGYSTPTLTIAEFNANGSIDASFGTGGQITLPVASSYALLPLPSGQFLVAEGLESQQASGSGTATYAVLRINPNGAKDPSFGVSGVAQYPSTATTSAANRLAFVSTILPTSGGQFVLVGGSFGVTSSSDFATVRLNADGSLDTTYGTGGTADVPVTVNKFTDDNPSAAAIQSNGQILVAGTVQTNLLTTNPYYSIPVTEAGVIRLNADGSLDTTFGGSSTGALLIPPVTIIYGASSGSGGIAIDPTTGKALLAVTGGSESSSYLYRLKTDGTIDTSFGTGGSIPTNRGTGVAVQANGQILLVDTVVNQAPELVRLNTDGTPDKTFGTGQAPGVFVPKTPTINGISSSDLAIESDGTIVLGGIGTAPSPAGRVESLDAYQILSTTTTGTSARSIPTPPADFYGYGYTDAAVYDPTAGSFKFTPPNDPTFTPVFQFGSAGVGASIPAAADYLGVGSSQLAVYLPQYGDYAIADTTGSTVINYGATGKLGSIIQFGIPGAGQTIPVPADYQGTGKADVAVYLTALADFAIIPSNGSAAYLVSFGIAGAGQSIPAPADYYGTGQDDIAVYLAKYAAFAVQDPTGKTPGEVVAFGKPGLGNSIPVPGDYDGSGQTEFAVYIPSLGAYFYRSAISGKDVEVTIGTANSGQLPVPGDYDGEGHFEVAVYDPKAGTIQYKPASGAAVVTIAIGTANDNSIPIATPAGALSEFNPPGPRSGYAIRSAEVVSGSGTSTPSNAITISAAKTVPAGPTPTSLRVARTPIKQAAPAPFQWA